jgi:hypothetical protein
MIAQIKDKENGKCTQWYIKEMRFLYRWLLSAAKLHVIVYKKMVACKLREQNWTYEVRTSVQAAVLSEIISLTWI